MDHFSIDDWTIFQLTNTIDWIKRGYNHHSKFVTSNHKVRELIFQIDSRIESIHRLKEDYLYINSLRNFEIVE